MRKLFGLLATAAGLALIGWALLVGFRSPERLPGWLQRRPSIYLGIAIKHIRNTAMSSKPVDWDAVTAEAKNRARDAKTPAETYPAIRYVLDQLGEGYATLAPPPALGDVAGAYGMQVVFPERVVATVFPSSTAEAAGIKQGDVVELVDGQPPSPSTDPRTRGQFVDLPRPRVTLRLRRGTATQDVPLTIGTWQPLPAFTGKIAEHLGYVSVPGTTSDGAFAERIREAIAQTDGPAVCGWVVDLRRNNGGGLWPVLQAIRPILGEGSLGFVVSREGTRAPWEYPTTGAPATDRPPPPLARATVAVAVLTSRLTANAGETASIAFRGRPHARVFGDPTWGVPATRTTVPLVDGASLDLTTALMADRSGKVYEGRIAPDEPAPIDWARLNAPDDPVISVAGAWLSAQPPCQIK